MLVEYKAEVTAEICVHYTKIQCTSKLVIPPISSLVAWKELGQHKPKVEYSTLHFFVRRPSLFQTTEVIELITSSLERVSRSALQPSLKVQRYFVSSDGIIVSRQ